MSYEKILDGVDVTKLKGVSTETKTDGGPGDPPARTMLGGMGIGTNLGGGMNAFGHIAPLTFGRLGAGLETTYSKHDGQELAHLGGVSTFTLDGNDKYATYAKVGYGIDLNTYRPAPGVNLKTALTSFNIGGGYQEAYDENKKVNWSVTANVNIPVSQLQKTTSDLQGGLEQPYKMHIDATLSARVTAYIARGAFRGLGLYAGAETGSGAEAEIGGAKFNVSVPPSLNAGVYFNLGANNKSSGGHSY